MGFGIMSNKEIGIESRDGFNEGCCKKKILQFFTMVEKYINLLFMASPTSIFIKLKPHTITI